jgi:hypothetical protein
MRNLISTLAGSTGAVCLLTLTGCQGIKPATPAGPVTMDGHCQQNGAPQAGCCAAHMLLAKVQADLPEGSRPSPLHPDLRIDADGVVRGPARLWSPSEYAIACFDASGPASPAILAQVEARMRAGRPKYNAIDRWLNTASGPTTLNQPIVLTWSLVPDGLPASPDDPSNPGVDASVMFSRMDTLFGGNRALWISKIQEAFDRWGALTGTSYVRVTSGGNDWDDGAAWGTAGNTSTRGDVRIGMRNIDGASNVLAFNAFPDSGDMVLDSSENWASSGNNYRFLRNVLMHEHGHGLGLAHTCPTLLTKLMEPTYTSNFDGPQQDDIRAVQELYGDASEPNNFFTNATAIGAVNPGVVVTRGTVPSPAVANASTLSIISNDADWFSFATTIPSLVRVTVTPIGSSYSTSNCSAAAVTTNALTFGDLRLDVAQNSAGNILATASSAAAGALEQVTGLLLDAGTFHARVTAPNNPVDTQMYTLQIAAGLAPIVNATGQIGQVSLNWSAVTGGTFEVYRATVNDRAQSLIVGTSATNTFIDTTAPAGVPVFYFIRASQSGRPMVNWGQTAAAVSARLDCGASDVAGPGQTLGADSQLTADDIIVFVNWFFASDTRADVAGSGQVLGADGQFTADDLIVFINRFFAGCQ